MDTNLVKQFMFLINENTGAKLEKIIEQVIESEVININELFNNENVKKVSIY
jgi:hypothetical protein